MYPRAYASVRVWRLHTLYASGGGSNAVGDQSALATFVAHSTCSSEKPRGRCAWASNTAGTACRVAVGRLSAAEGRRCGGKRAPSRLTLISRELDSTGTGATGAVAEAPPRITQPRVWVSAAALGRGAAG